MSNWIYQGKEILTEEDIPFEKPMGFIYLITQKSTGKRYIGRKLLTKAKKKSFDGKKKKIRVQSDWQKYWSSSPQIKEWIKEAGGTSDFTREILAFVSSKGSLAYLEEKALYELGVLESDNWINNNIRSKIYRSWVKVEEAKELQRVLDNIKEKVNES